jgi:glycine/D-amino acid oxidase-like deaminating enzyme/nitrite reductase/ring-hydroxylating ferredoxin subunit
MSTATISTESIWLVGEEVPDAYPSLCQDTSADVCIVGAGIAGLSVAYALCSEGKSVVVLDAHDLGGGETSHTTAHLVNALDDRFTELEWIHGEEGARLAAESHTAAIDWIEAIVDHERISCEFERVSGYLFVPGGENPDRLRKELAAAHRAGLKRVSLLEQTPLIAAEAGPCLHFPDQAQFHPMKYLRGLATAVERMGGKIYGKTYVSEFVGGADARIVTKSSRQVKAGAIVVATNTPVNDRVVIHTKQAAYQTYVIGLRVDGTEATKALWWDTLDPYHYVRFGRTNGELREDILIVGGEDHKTGQDGHPEERWGTLEIWARERFPFVGDVAFRWSGEIMEPQDGLAFIGRNPMGRDNVYIVTGDSGNGMTHGTIAGMLITDLILGRENRWARLYDPSRKSLRCAYTFMKENLNAAAQYTDWVTSGEISSPEELTIGQGALMRQGLKKLALFRDDKGEVHSFSATCPHLKGIVAFNSAEQTWDCPCHGSRFSATTGDVIHGPSLSGLSPVELREKLKD